MSVMRCGWALITILLTVGAAASQEPGNVGGQAPEFPPGKFSDGRQYRLADLRGKVVVLFFYESKCPRCKASIPQRNEVVRALKDKPVVFLAVGASDPAQDVLNYVRETGLAMPVFIDSLGLMEARYKQEISLKNIWQFRVIGPDGKIVGYEMETPDLLKIVARTNPKWKFRGEGDLIKLGPALDALEAGRYGEGMKLLGPLRRPANGKDMVAAATKLQDAVRTEAAGWMEQAASAAQEDPVSAYDLYAKAEAALPADEVGKKAGDSARQLKAKKPVSAELAARRAFAELESKLSAASPAHKKAAAKLCQDLAKKHPNTPTAAKALALVEELGG